MIFFCETNRTNGEHAFINGKLLLLIAKAFPDHTMQCYASSSHWKVLSDIIGDDCGCSFSAITVVEPKAKQKIRWIFKIFLECFTAIGLLKKAIKCHASLVFFSSMSPLANYLVHLWLKWFVSVDIKVVITLHGELQLLKGNNRKLIDKLYASSIRKALRTRLANRKFLVLNELIKSELVLNHTIDASVILEIPHPYQEKYVKFNKIASDKKVFGHIGTAKLAKNSHLFFDLAARNKDHVISGKAVFLINGQVLPEILPFQNRYVEYQDSTSFVELSKYEELCLAMRCAVFMYTDDQYSMVSSGAIMDAIAFGLPVIGLRNRYFEYLFSLCSVNPGILCENYEEIVSNIRRLIQDNDDNYVQYLTGIHELQAYFSLERIQDKFNNQIKRLSITP